MLPPAQCVAFAGHSKAASQLGVYGLCVSRGTSGPASLDREAVQGAPVAAQPAAQRLQVAWGWAFVKMSTAVPSLSMWAIMTTVHQALCNTCMQARPACSRSRCGGAAMQAATPRLSISGLCARRCQRFETSAQTVSLQRQM